VQGRASLSTLDSRKASDNLLSNPVSRGGGISSAGLGDLDAKEDRARAATMTCGQFHAHSDVEGN
jgi:hypothetical protein